MNYKFQVNEEHDFQLTPELVKSINLQSAGEGNFHILKNNKSYSAKVVANDFANRKLTILINGNKYKIKITDEYDELVKKLGLSVAAGQKVKEIKAPMPGLVLDVMAKIGQTVQKGDGLLILEAMKMENVIKAQGDGVVKLVQIEKGQTVEKGAILVEME
ncbi:MAG: biotin carboxyl carrier protein [Polaribacter sp.]|jgi:biotin carboxyl carrier protein